MAVFLRVALIRRTLGTRTDSLCYATLRTDERGMGWVRPGHCLCTVLPALEDPADRQERVLLCVSPSVPLVSVVWKCVTSMTAAGNRKSEMINMPSLWTVCEMRGSFLSE
jgi:hypothetical protein